MGGIDRNNCVSEPATLDYKAECEKLKRQMERACEENAELHAKCEKIKAEYDRIAEKHEMVCAENKRLYEQNLRLERQVDGFVCAFRALITRS